MNQDALIEFQMQSQKIYDAWRRDPHSVKTPAPLLPEFLPEPYLYYGSPDAANLCVFLTTNPGGPMDVQLPEGVEEQFGGRLPDGYLPLATTMAAYYERTLQQKPAGKNVERMKSIAKEIGRPNILQIEIIPWHSRSLPGKKTILNNLMQIELYSSYNKAIKQFLDSCDVIFSWSAGTPLLRRGDGMDLKANFMRLDLKAANCHVILPRPNGPSQCMFWKRDGDRLRALFVTRGSATLPTDKGGRHKEIAAVLMG